MESASATGSRFASALAAKDADALRSLLHPQVEFRALTPRRSWDADDPQSVLDIVFGHWFEASDNIEALESVETEGSFLVEQQGYLTTGEDGRIVWMRLVCSGYRPTGA
jgi:hypothetical protein